MYRAIFLFNVSEMMPALTAAAQACLSRKPDLLKSHSIHNLITAWIHHQLWEHLHLAILPSVESCLIPQLDGAFLNNDLFLRARLLSHVGVAIYPENNPYYESWCELSVEQDDLMLVFEMGPIDYSAKYNKGISQCSWFSQPMRSR